jgi:2-dehydropantoate 2-reductase
MASIAVIGAGGVGGLLAGRLARGGHDVRVLARGAALEVIRARGLRLRGPDGDHLAPVALATDEVSAMGAVDLVLVAVKTWQVLEVAPRLPPLVRDDTVVVPLQNGVEAVAHLASTLGQERVVGGLCHMLSWVEQPGEIGWMGAGPSVTLGARRPAQAEPVARCAAVLRSADIHVEVTGAIESTLWVKLLFIAPFGAVGAAARLSAGPLRRDSSSRARLEAAMREVAAVAGGHGVVLPADTVDLAMRRIDSLPEDATASLYRDIARGRPSELNELIGAVDRLGREARIATPVSAALYAELLPLEQRAREAARGS